jgi:hypothetical protein
MTMDDDEPAIDDGRWQWHGWRRWISYRGVCFSGFGQRLREDKTDDLDIVCPFPAKKRGRFQLDKSFPLRRGVSRQDEGSKSVHRIELSSSVR